MINELVGAFFDKLFIILFCRVGFQYRFAIIYDDGESDLEIEDHFLKRLRAWRNKKG